MKVTCISYGFNIPNKLPRQPEERLLEIIVGFGRDLEVLKVLLPVECDGARLDFALLSTHGRRWIS